ncbi:transposase [Streptosporangium canum]|uniref:transposase n=1 Tax=Streptosporangium canum TaxID=324952 RepID=UPI0033A4B315
MASSCTLINVAVALRTNSTIAFPCVFHLVGCSTYRRPVLSGRIEERLNQVIGEVSEEKRAGVVRPWTWSGVTPRTTRSGDLGC